MAGLTPFDDVILYDDPCGCPLAAPEDIPPDLQKALDQMTRDIYDLKLEGKISRDVLSLYAKKITEAAGLGFCGKEGVEAFRAIDYDTPDFLQLSKLMSHAWQFSAAKSYAQTRELTHLLIDGNGKPRTWRDFKTAAEQVNANYASRYLKTEYDMAHNAATMSAKWTDIERNQSLLEFDAVVDAQTTEICAPLHGTILPFDHPFWKTYYPPNHWNCRSTVRQLRGGTDSVRVTPEGDLKHIDVKPMFRINMGERGLAFPAEHPYFKEAPEWVIKEGGAAYSKWTLHEVQERLGGKKFNTPAGEILIAKNGIKKLVHIHNPLVWVLDTVVKNAERISEKLLNVPDGKGRSFTYDYLKIKGINEFLVIRTDINSKLKIAYDIVPKIKTD